ncbi:hypothetical protein G6F56_009624 [Rhizopus delemar]|uniref:Uncharacterized protein n=1 Tax=Rhizopus stolonifer TaxID=4846 RepID=A0A367JU24_RHIST|nr:hypothetical protein G6F56_009624 [Rhizopus delemar]RCH93191.1 hypothetical protein CU098_009257 [Rhizopus stolonifer]
MTDKEDDMVSTTSNDSDYSLDYEYIGPREPNIRQDTDSDCSELSDSPGHGGFDMWDEDPHSTNEFTWDSNDMKLTHSIKIRQTELKKYWPHQSFYNHNKGWPLQLPLSCSTTNHDQSANSLCLLLSDLGVSERLHAIYRDRIIECGAQMGDARPVKQEHENDTTWLESQDTNSHLPSKSIDNDLFNETHAFVSLSPSIQQQQQQQNTPCLLGSPDPIRLLSKCVPYTKYIQRSDIPTAHTLNTYLSLSFEPLCFEEKYGYMAIGGLEGEFEIYCCMEEQPHKIFGTQFKGKNNVLLMTNAIQIVRLFPHTHLLIVSMNDAGLLVYSLSKHDNNHHLVSLVHHIPSFSRMPINDARLSPDGQHLVCVGDDAFLFYLPFTLPLAQPQQIPIPTTASYYSSQHISWSKSSLYFAHTSDTDHHVLVWRVLPRLEMIHRIDAGGSTLAIRFHPEHEGVLAFSNRYGYLHTVDLEEAKPNQLSTEDPDWMPRQEITMVSFRGEKNRRLRILAKINGIQWSRDGKHLYVSTKKRVLVYQFMKSNQVDSLERLATEKILTILETRKRQFKSSIETFKKETKKFKKDLDQLPECIQKKLKQHHLASH